MSHSAGHAALTLGYGVDALGVDLEHARPRPFADLLSAFARPEEEAWWQQSPDPGQAFYRLWTLKEALFKAQSADAEPRGLMALGLRRPVATGQAWRLQGPDERDWRGISAMLSPDIMLACVWVSSAVRTPFSTDGVLGEIWDVPRQMAQHCAGCAMETGHRKLQASCTSAAAPTCDNAVRQAQSILRKTSDVLSPPNAKLLLTTYSVSM